MDRVIHRQNSLKLPFTKEITASKQIKTLFLLILRRKKKK